MPKPAAIICWKVAPLIQRDSAFCSFSRAWNRAGRDERKPLNPNEVLYRLLLARTALLHRPASGEPCCGLVHVIHGAAIRIPLGQLLLCAGPLDRILELGASFARRQRAGRLRPGCSEVRSRPGARGRGGR